uniref:Uncharacterized protein n=1 Tax=Arundo donax TaxID=35708 RepID=A0A0A9FQK8_ARUDO
MKLAATVKDILIYKMAFRKPSLNWQKAHLPLGGYSNFLVVVKVQSSHTENLHFSEREHIHNIRK